jgi:hypothetical protein
MLYGTSGKASSGLPASEKTRCFQLRDILPLFARSVDPQWERITNQIRSAPLTGVEVVRKLMGHS